MSQEEKIHPFSPAVVWGFRLGLAIIIILAAIGIARLLIASAPKHERRPQRERSVVVEVQALRRQNQPVTVEVTGTVVPARELAISPRVSGYIDRMSPDFQPGGRLRAGDVLLVLDKTDFELARDRAEAALKTAEAALRQAEGNLVNAQYAYQLEQGQQEVARYEWETLADRQAATELEKELTLRKPHLRKARADVETAEARVKAAEIAIRDARTVLEQAELNVTRAEVKVPFDAVVIDRSVAEGALVTPQTVLGKVAATDECWVEASVPVSRLDLIRFPENGDPGARVTATISMGNGDTATWAGDIFGLRPVLEANGRMARVLARIRSPFDQAFPLLLDTFVHLSIQGGELRDVFVIPRSAFHEGDRVWLMNEERRLEFRSVKPLWSNAEIIAVTNSVRENEQLVLTNISAASPGLKLMLPGEAEKEQKNAAGSNQKQPKKSRE